MPIVHPSVAVLTSIGPEHLEQLMDVPTVAREEGFALSMTSQAGGTIVINLDDPWIRPYSAVLRQGKQVRFSLEPRSPEAGLLVGTLSADGSRVRLQGLELDGLELPLPLLGRHNASNLLAAVATARALGLEGTEIARGLTTFQGADGRSEVRELPEGGLALCDWYNAQPLSMLAGFELLTELSRRGGRVRERWACLADMLELGPGEEGFHRGLAPKLVELGIEHVLLLGSRMKWLEDELKLKGFPGAVSHHASHAELASALRSGFKPGHALMIKGSRSMRMEEVWKSWAPAASVSSVGGGPNEAGSAGGGL